jgi:hypothetical protein
VPEAKADAEVIVGVVIDGDVANTKAPLPVSPVTASANFADVGSAKKAATLVPKLATDAIGYPVQLARFPEDGVPKAGVTRTGDEAKTKAPVPVSPVIVLINSADVVEAKSDNLLPVVVKVPAVGNVTLEAAVVVNVKLCPPEVIREELFASVSVAAVAGAVKVTLLIVVAEATPNVGVTRVGDVANTKAPLPVSPVTASANLADVGSAKKAATLVPKLATDAIGYPVQLARFPEDGVPKAGVVKLGDEAKTKFPVPVVPFITFIKSATGVDAKTLSLLP